MNKITASVAGISFALKDNPALKYSELKEGEKLSVIPEPENEECRYHLDESVKGLVKQSEEKS